MDDPSSSAQAAKATKAATPINTFFFIIIKGTFDYI